MAVVEAVGTERRPAVPTRRDRWFSGLVAICAASSFVLLWIGRDQWFFADEWAFLVDRDLSDPGGLLEPHNGHWVAVPVLLYRINFRLFGLNTYLPYQLPVVLAHLGTILLLYLVARRLGARPWIAAVVPAAVIFFGSGATNVLFGFQVALTASLFCGLGHMLLADHEGPISRRDALAIAVGTVGLMSSAVGIAMTVGVGTAVLLRRGLRVALVHTLPLAALYLLWFATYGRQDASRAVSFERGVVAFVAEMARAAFEGLGRWTPAAVALAAVAGLGLAGVARSTSRSSRPSGSPALALGLVVAFVAFATLTAVARIGFGVESAASGRYVHVAAMLFVPLVAAGTEVLASGNRLLAFVPVLLIAAALPWNVDRLVNREPITLGSRDAVAAAAHSPFLRQVPEDQRYFTSVFWPDIGPTAGWLRRAVAGGRIPEPDGATAQQLLRADLVLAVVPGSAQTPDAECPPTSEPVRTEIRRGDRIRFSGPIEVVAERGGVRSLPMIFDGSTVRSVDVVAGPLTVQIRAPRGAATLRLCGIDRGAHG